uniref:Uncharacterized protein n=1 Tax=Cyanistes caeruleus TaxID=156563 RepID=A0A8C0VRI9_CYACU
MLLPEGSRHREHPASLSVSHPLPQSSGDASLGISPSSLQASCITWHPLLLAPHRGEDKDGYKDRRKRSQTPRPPRLRAARSKAQPGSELLTCTVCQTAQGSVSTAQHDTVPG